MNRRQFLNLSLPATGAVILSNALLNREAYAEISRQFSGDATFEIYDIVINGAGLAGYFAAIHAAKQGKKVLLVEKRPSPGYDIAFKGKLWLKTDGFEKLSPDLRALFLPVQERQEIKNKNGLGEEISQLGDEIGLFKGSIRKSLLRNLLIQKVDTLLMTDTCGLFQSDGHVTGALLACKQGVYAVKCKSFLDASDKLLFTRKMINQDIEVSKAGFVLELNKVNSPEYKKIGVPKALGLYQDCITARPGKLSDNQLFLSFEYPVDTNDLDAIEHKARILAQKIGTQLKTLDTTFSNAQIYQYAYETSLYLEDEAPPQPQLNGQYVLANDVEELSCSTILSIEKKSMDFIYNLKIPSSTGNSEKLRLPGRELALEKLEFQALNEPGFTIPLRQVKLDWKQAVKARKETQVVVAGGGTAGALAALAAIEKGADTIVIDYFNDLGGTKTMGGVMAYYHGVRENTFFKKQNEEAEQIAFEANMNKKIGRKLYHLKAILDRGGQFVSSAILCGTLAEHTKVTGVLVCRHGQLEIIEGPITVDATGDGDVAAFAGASYQIGDSRVGLTQNYSQWDVAGSGKLPSNTNRDYDIIDNTKIAELQRGLLISHYEAHFYDFHHYLTVRESRRIDSIRNIDLIDCAEETHFEDVLSLASSNFDLHGIGSSEFTKCGFLLPKSNNLIVEVPYRALVPKELDGLLIAGRAYGQTHNALQFTRMSADLLVLGYLVGQIAADIAWQGIQPRQYNVNRLQKEWTLMDYLPAKYLTRKAGNKRGDMNEIKRRVEQLENGALEYLYECSRLDKNIVLPLLKERFTVISSQQGKLLLAKMLAWFGESLGNSLIEDELKQLVKEEEEKGYPGGYMEDYDFIRDRKENRLEGLFWRINQNIALLAMSNSSLATPTIKYILENTVSGGEMGTRTNEYYDDRMDLKTVPFHNRILNLCFYAEKLPDRSLIPGFEKLLKDERIRGFVTTSFDKVRWRVYGGSLELSIAAALARCGGREGYFLLRDYLDDLHFNFKHFALSELKELTKKDFGYEQVLWQKYLSKLSYPQPLKPLKKEVEV